MSGDFRDGRWWFSMRWVYGGGFVRGIGRRGFGRR